MPPTPPDTLIVSASPGERRAALLAGGEAVEFAVMRDHHRVGSVWRGRVASIDKHLGAAFVELDGGPPGFLPAGGLREGDPVIVQVQAEALGEKGPKLGRDVALLGRWLVLHPLRRGRTVSRKVAPEQRQRLTALLDRLARADEGIDLRAAAASAPDEAIAAELDALRARWANAAAGPEMLPADPLRRLLADNPQVERILADDAVLAATLGGSHAPRAWAEAGLDEALAAALEPVSPLPGGGRLIIEATAALTAIDVDSGGRAAADANQAAVIEAARQMRLRALAGHILLDLIPERGRDRLRASAEALKAAVAPDPTPTHVVGTTPLGMVELTRERRRPPLAELMLAPATARPSVETAALALLRRALAEASACGGRALTARVGAQVARRLTGSAALTETERRLGRPLRLIIEDTRAPGAEDVTVEP